jgi:4a-hydroxytetrahydrobiopterin dehydratase
MPEPTKRLTEKEIAQRLHDLPGWELKDKKLTRAFSFDDFMGAIDFVNRIAQLAESEGHHPDLQVGWGRVVVELTSHDAGGLTPKDFKVASLIDKL